MSQIRVCNSRSCSAFGANSIMKAVSDATGLQPGEKNAEDDLDWTGCLGWCSNSPNVEVDGKRIIMDSTPDTIMQRIKSGEGFKTDGEIRDLDFDNNFLGDL